MARWLHIYLSMFGFATILFFAVTGITLNHPDWFGLEEPVVDVIRGELPVEWFSASADSDELIDRLAIAETLRSRHALQGAVSEFRVDDFDCSVGFKGPAYAADALIDRETGRYELSISRHGAIALVNDLHKGRDSGPAWSVLIDVSALLMALSSITGVVLLLYIRRKRWPGLITAAAGTAAIVAVFVWLVP
ncbi:MAG: PepSY-associated TM helix domain-containing protein [Planctomycetaceae bacterium]|nr:PepSY-associated TM helix domain-containing protein [Planctomycetaceae bacterium]